MGILGENAYENLGMMSHSIKMFWTCVEKHKWFMMMKNLNWVRLSQKFICISISSLAGEV